MKYRCTDCGCEYDVKPEYCDCGNNIFEEISTQPKVDEIKQKEEKPQQIIKNVAKPKEKLSQPFDFIGWGFFGLCIILSLLALIFIRYENTEAIVEQETNTVKQLQNIPQIDSIWKESKQKPVLNQQISAPQQVQQEIKPQPIVKKPVVKQTSTTKPKQVSKIVQKQTTKKQEPPKTSSKQTIVNNIIPKTTQNIAQSTSKNTTSKPQTTNEKKTTQVQQTQQPTQSPAVIKQELENYKISLMKTISRKIDFAQVVGDGNCAVSFKIDSNGKLIDRKFTKQSQNSSLNDVVYNAMMQTPSYNKAPVGYKNETLTLTVKMYAGNFEVNLK